MFWADKLLENVSGKQLVDDSFTPSGMVHMGSLKGPVIHDVLYRVLKEKGSDVEFYYGFDDADVIDGLSPDLERDFSKYLGMPLYKAPSPDGKGSFADYFRNRMQKLLDQLGVKPTWIYRTSQLYNEGKFDEAIRIILNNAQKVRDLYSRIYSKEVSKDWIPFQVVCPNCGKLGTTKVTSWDGKEVSFSCQPNLVKWAQGCGYSGKASPFGGKGKLPWKIEWAAKWWVFEVTIEGAGKDHASAGGSYDIAMNIIRDVFEGKQPLNFAYEFFLSGGKKMSSSKGIGITGEELLAVLAPEVARFLMIKNPPNQAVEFTPRNSYMIPTLYDEYQLAYLDYLDYKENKNDYDVRAFKFSAVGEVKPAPLESRFISLVGLIQANKYDEIKGKGLEEWVPYAKVWQEKYAPEEVRFVKAQEIPEIAKLLSDIQKEYLQRIAGLIDQEWQEKEFQQKLYEEAKEIGLSSDNAFQSIYKAWAGKDHGPKAAFLILGDKEFAKKRFEEVANLA